MKITMLGGTGSGKTVFMSAMSQIFINSVTNGFVLRACPRSTTSAQIINRSISEIDTIIDYKFPDGTTKTSVMNFTLFHNNREVIDIDWFDYKGGAVDELANGITTDSALQLKATLLASDIILVFIDCVVLATEKHMPRIKRLTNANNIASILNDIAVVRKDNIIFLLSKFGSDIVNKNALEFYKTNAIKAYDTFFSRGVNVESYKFIPIDCIGFNRTKTTVIRDEKDNKVKKVETIIIDDPIPYNIDAAFAYALQLCVNRAKNNNQDEVDLIERKLLAIENDLSGFWGLLRFMFNKGGIIDKKFDLKEELNIIEISLKNLTSCENDLKKIWVYKF
jgi:hypothetical protein